MSFSFSFSFESDAPAPSASESDAPAPSSPSSSPAARLLALDDDQATVDINVPSTQLSISGRTFLRVDEDRVTLNEQLVSALTTSASSTTDLIPGVYEGGLRVWEGSVDLVAYMAANPDILLQPASRRRRKRPRRCLELGCGHGFPGIFVLQQQQQQQQQKQQQRDAPWQVCFSDFNEEVLSSVTWPNVLMNTTGSTRFNACYVAGEWLSLRPIVESLVGVEQDSAAAAAAAADEEELAAIVAEVEGAEGSAEAEAGAEADANRVDTGLFDLILTAETCYTEQSCRDVARIIADLLRMHVRAVAIVASKRFYFGTGGSALCFRDNAARHGLDVVVAQVIDDGRSNIREVMEVRRSRP
jgi:hypothetical protein